MKDKGILITAYVIMPNHIHFIAYQRKNASDTLNQSIATSKRFWAYGIVKRLQNSKKENLLRILQEGVKASEKKKGKKHQVFKLSFDAKICDSKKMLERFIDYIHANPVTGKWSLTESFIDYPHSSAAFYEEGMDKPDFLVDYRNLLDAV